jgi:hypothetical protein
MPVGFPFSTSVRTCVRSICLAAFLLADLEFCPNTSYSTLSFVRTADALGDDSEDKKKELT